MLFNDNATFYYFRTFGIEPTYLMGFSKYANFPENGKNHYVNLEGETTDF